MKRLILFLTILFSLSLLYAQELISLKASCGKYLTDEMGVKAIPQGIYPIKLTVTTYTSEKTLYVKIYRSEKEAGPYKLIIDTMQPNEEYFYLYDDTNLSAEKKYYYIAVLGKYKLEDAPLEQKSKPCIGWTIKEEAPAPDKKKPESLSE